MIKTGRRLAVIVYLVDEFTRTVIEDHALSVGIVSFHAGLEGDDEIVQVITGTFNALCVV